MLDWLKRGYQALKVHYLRVRYRPGKIISGFIARDVERKVLVVAADEIDKGYLTVRIRTNNLLYMSVGAVGEEAFGPPQRVAIEDLCKWSGQSWGGLPDCTSITDGFDAEFDSETPHQAGSIDHLEKATSNWRSKLLLLSGLCLGIFAGLQPMMHSEATTSVVGDDQATSLSSQISDR